MLTRWCLSVALSWLVVALPPFARGYAGPGLGPEMLPNASNAVLPAARSNLGLSAALNAKTDYGAKGDNATNDGPALASALAACNGAAPLYLPPGQYRTQQKLTVPAHCHLVGDNTFTYYTGGGGPQPGAVIIGDNSGGGFSAGDAVVTLTDQTSMVDGVAAFGISAVADSFKLAAGGVLRHVLAANGRYGINCAAGLAIITDSETSFTSNVGVYGQCADQLFLRNWVHSGGATAGYYGPATVKAQLIGNVFEWNAGYGVYFDNGGGPVADITIIGNKFDHNSLENLALKGVSNVTVTGNSFRRGYSSGTGHAHIKYFGAITGLSQVGNSFRADPVNDDGSGALIPDYDYDADVAATFTKSLIADNPPAMTTGIYSSGAQAIMAASNLALPVAPNAGGTGVANAAGSTLTLGGALATTGTGAATLGFPNSAATFTFPGSSQTLASLAGAETLSSKSLNAPVFVTGGAEFQVAPFLDNAVALKAKDGGGTLRTLLQLFSDNKTYVDGGASGLVLRDGNSTNTVGTSDGSGNFSFSHALSLGAAKVHALNVAQATPSNPTGTTSTTGVMMGLAGAITPTYTGAILIMVSGDITNSTAADGAKVQLRFGTGTTPTNGAALTGTACGGLVQLTPVPAAATKIPFSLHCIVTGQTLATALWLDVSLAAITGGTASIADLSVTASEM